MPRATPRATFRDRLNYCSEHPDNPASSPPAIPDELTPLPEADSNQSTDVRSLGRGVAALAGCVVLAVSLFYPVQMKDVATTGARTTAHAAGDVLATAVRGVAKWLVTGSLPARP